MASTKYLALLRGINVGGNSMIKMANLKTMFESCGFSDVKTYIQSGNVLFSSELKDETKIIKIIEEAIHKSFGLDVAVAIFSKPEWEVIIKNAPSWWGVDKSWKHNLLVLLPPYNINQVIADVGELKPDIEKMTPGEGALYQSLSLALFGRTTTGKLASKPVYKRMTIRNYNTATKLLNLF